MILKLIVILVLILINWTRAVSYTHLDNTVVIWNHYIKMEEISQQVTLSLIHISSISCNASKRAFICWIFRFATIFNVGVASLEMACIKHFNSWISNSMSFNSLFKFSFDSPYTDSDDRNNNYCQNRPIPVYYTAAAQICLRFRSVCSVSYTHLHPVGIAGSQIDQIHNRGEFCFMIVTQKRYFCVMRFFQNL